MTQSAWIFLIVVWSIVLAMTVYCFARLLGSRQFHESEAEALHDEVTPAHGPPDT